MKKLIPISFGLLLASGGFALAISLLSGRQVVSLTLLEYRRWPSGAMLRLTNGTQTSISYLAERNGTPAGYPVLSLNKTSSGWTNTSPAIKTESFLDPRSRKFIQFYKADYGASSQSANHVYNLLSRDLKPGQSVDFFVWLEPGALPRRVGTICCVPQSKLAEKMHSWLVRAGRWLGITTAAPGQMEVWCPKPLYLSSSGQEAMGK